MGGVGGVGGGGGVGGVGRVGGVGGVGGGGGVGRVGGGKKHRSCSLSLGIFSGFHNEEMLSENFILDVNVMFSRRWG